MPRIKRRRRDIVSRVDDPHLLVFAVGRIFGAAKVPVNGLYSVWVVVEGEGLAPACDIPQLDGVVEGDRGEDVVGDGVPPDENDLLRVAGEGEGGVVDVLGGPVDRELPHLHGAVVACACDHFVVKGREREIHHRPPMPRQHGHRRGQPPRLGERPHDKRAPAAPPWQTKVLGVYVAEVRVGRGGTRHDVVIVILLPDRLSEDVPEL
mmetsp:Transcript_42648/g.106722  ORF Transcript_42648/g.106722 Transcript_42648/m.106722 type:complete len:207 (-) Transcript_42648:175-795(-)